MSTPTSDTPETDAACETLKAQYFHGTLVSPEFARSLERQRDEARRQLAESQAQVVALRAALGSALDYAPECNPQHPSMVFREEERCPKGHRYCCGNCEVFYQMQEALSQPAPPVVSKAEHDALWEHAERLVTTLRQDAMRAFNQQPPRSLRAEYTLGGAWTASPNKCRVFFQMRKEALAAHETLKAKRV